MSYIESGAAGLPLRRLGRSEILASAVGAGCWAIGGPDWNLGLPMGWRDIDDDEALAGLHAAYERGVNLYDTADVYGHGRSERLIGAFVRTVDRESLVLTSKVGYFSGTAAHAYDPVHMRHQLEQSLQNLHTDYLDIYFLHNANFGVGDRHLEGAIEALTAFRERGLIRAVGMRGPHRYALDRLQAGTPKDDKVVRFEQLFTRVNPEILAVRDNLLSPFERGVSIYRFAEANDCGVLINKPLSQGLLTGAYRDAPPKVFGDGDHRQRKAWFRAEPLALINDGLRQLALILGSNDPHDLIRVAVWACLSRSQNAVVLCGFTNAAHAVTNADAGREPVPDDVIRAARRVMGEVQRQLDELGEVFSDEVGGSE